MAQAIEALHPTDGAERKSEAVARRSGAICLTGKSGRGTEARGGRKARRLRGEAQEAFTQV